MGYLRITNRGLAAAAHIYAKSSLPSWVFMRDPRQHQQGEGKGGSSTSGGGDGVCMSMVGVSGTVFRVVKGTLTPNGGSLRVPVWMRGLGGGKQTLK